MSVEQIPIDQNGAVLSPISNLDVPVERRDFSSKENEGPLLEKESELNLSVAEKSQQLNEQRKLEKEALAEQDKSAEQSKEEVDQVLEVINQLIPLKNTNLIFEFDDIADPPIVKVIDKNTDEIIREIPPKDIREIAQAFNDMADSISKAGALFSSEV